MPCSPANLAGQFEQPYRPMGPPTLFTIPVLRYMKTYGLTHEQLAMVAVVQRQWAAKCRDADGQSKGELDIIARFPQPGANTRLR